MRKLKIPAIILAVLCVLSGAAVLILPAMIDTKPIVSALNQEVETLTGRPLVIGAASVSVFPSAAITIDGFAIRNDEAASKNHLLNAQKAIIRFSLLDALSGKLPHRADIELVSPNIELERFADGRASWHFPAASQSAQPRIELTLRLSNGTVNFTHNVRNYFETINGINGSIDLNAARFSASLSAHMRKQPVSLSTLCNLHQFQGFNQFDADCGTSIEQAGNRVEYQGRIVKSAASLVNRGKLTLKSTDSRSWIDVVFGRGKTPFTDYYGQALPLEIQADSYTDGKQFVVNLEQIVSGNSKGKGSFKLNMADGADDAVGVNLWFDTLDIDQLAPDGVLSTQTETNLFSLNHGLPDTIIADIQLQAQSLTFHKVDFSNVVSTSRLEDGEVIVSNMTMKTPNDGNIITLGRLVAKNEGLEYDGQVEAYGNSLRALAPLVGIEQVDIPENAFGQFRSRFNMIARPDLTIISELRLVTGDRVQLAGGVNLYHKKKQIDATIGLRYFDFAPFEALWLKGASLLDNPAEKTDHPFGFEWLKTMDDTINLTLQLEDYILFGAAGQATRVNLVIKPNQLNIADISAAWNESQISGRVSLKHEAEKPKPEISGQLSISQLNLGDSFLDTMRATPEEQRLTPGIWSRSKRIAAWPLHYFNGAMDLRISRLRHAKVDMNSIRCTVKLENARITFHDAKATVWGAPAQFNLVLDSAVVPGLELTFATQSSQLGEFLSSLVEYDTITGSVTLMGKISFSGLNYHDWVQNINGYVTFDARNIFVQNFNLPAIVRAITTVRAVSGLANSIRMAQDKGSTRIDNVNGTVAVGAGKLDISRITLRSNESVGEISGSVDLQQWMIGMVARLGLVTIAQSNYPFLMVNVTGPVNAPEIILDPKEIEAHLARNLR